MNEVIENKKKSEILAEKIASLNYGDVIMHEDIEILIDEPHPSPKYSATIQKAKKLLLRDHCMCIESIIGDGYRIVNPDNFVTQSLKHYKRGAREIQKGEDTLKHAPVKKMTEEGRIVYRRVYDKAIILNAAMQGAIVEMKTLGKREHPFANINN